MARGGRPRRIRQRNGVWSPHPPLSRVAVDGNDAAGGTNGAGERFRCVGGNTARHICNLIAALRPDVIHPDGASRIDSFAYEPWPRWRYKIDDNLVIEQELFVPNGESAV